MTMKTFCSSDSPTPHTVIHKALRTVLRNNQQSIFAIKKQMRTVLRNQNCRINENKK